ncbi:hypothetical protein [Micromonospora sp. NPDC000442]|uniref:hypothetical protein n=1 Tax=Micromonospora sp. NPDC000442 TaxID=3364217 RepID=UPI0036ADF6FE
MTSAFGAAVRAWRDRLSVADTGLPATARRRAAGLRREELASLAGLSVDYVVRLEQGRARSTRPRRSSRLWPGPYSSTLPSATTCTAPRVSCHPPQVT